MQRSGIIQIYKRLGLWDAYLIYQNQSGDIKIDVRLEEETVWLSQSQMSTLFAKDKRTISEHISNIFKEG